ncbi:MAG: crossover junction endodeoxyribonuclease RuvC [Deltaproteobacteria bacterium]|nr:crossover junction endodeoxyribonuclease RuvC [Deltaproteobacteria bacterium]
MIKIIGIDPGLSDTGIGIVTGEGLRVREYSYGTVSTSKRESLPGRLAKIYSRLYAILNDEKPNQMIVEDVFSLNQYPKSGITLGKVTGVILLAGYQCDVPVSEVSVRSAKQILTGNGNAGKSQLEKAVRQKLKLQEPIRPDHASDALGLALIGLYRYREGSV